MTADHTPALRVIDSVVATEIPEDLGGFLEWLGGPCLLRVPGRDRSRVRAAAGLLHGNEPSGAVAIHSWLRSGVVPAVDALLFVGAVEAARMEPRFTHRMVPGGRDLNRVFAAPYEGPDAKVAEALLQQLHSSGCEALVDLHNASGSNPSFAITTRVDRHRSGLVSLFTRRCVHADVRLGTLIEALESVCPAVVIECGRAGEAAADRCGTDGLADYFQRDTLPTCDDITLYRRMIRVTVREGLDVVVANQPSGAPLTVRSDLERLNFERIAPGTSLGWSEHADALVARDGAGTDVSDRYLEHVDGELRAKRATTPIMITTSMPAVQADCLGYFVQSE